MTLGNQGAEQMPRPKAAGSKVVRMPPMPMPQRAKPALKRKRK